MITFQFQWYFDKLNLPHRKNTKNARHLRHEAAFSYSFATRHGRTSGRSELWSLRRILARLSWVFSFVCQQVHDYSTVTRIRPLPGGTVKLVSSSPVRESFAGLSSLIS